MNDDRRKFIQLLAAGAATGALPTSIGKALAIPANNATGTIADVEHVVILMQENRAFDHYLGTLSGVRGYADPRAVTLATGKPVFYQPGGTQGYTLPFRPNEANLGLTFIEDLAHDWETTHVAWNKGRYDGWVAAKGTTSMAYLTRHDIPFHYALADAFTICDDYHCSLLGPTDPNRYYMWTGWVGNDGKGGGPVIDNAEKGYSWSTFPEVLSGAGVTWKIYQDIGTGLTPAQGSGYTDDPTIGNYGDNSLLYFEQYINALPNSALYNGAKTGTQIAKSGGLFDILAADIKTGKLPQVSWVVAPEAYTEHPNWPANYGAYYISKVLDALTSNPAVWSKTAFIVTYDENDGFFDHVVPPTPPVDAAHGMSTVSTINEYFPGSTGDQPGVYGLGVRVPCFVVSPWSKGGYVNSQVFDHTSLIRFIQAVFGPRHGGLNEPNITPWRNAVCGDLTSAFNFRTPNGAPVRLPSVAGYKPPDNSRHDDYVPVPPVQQALPRQERGFRRARPLPYEMQAQAVTSAQSVDITFATTGQQAVVFQVRSANPLQDPRTYTVESGKTLADSWAHQDLPYDLSVSAPNGFLRRFKGNVVLGATGLRVRESYLARTRTIVLSLYNGNSAAVDVLVRDAYTGFRVEAVLQPNQTITRPFPLLATHGWYDLSVTTPAIASFGIQLAGHLEDGSDSFTDPAISLA